MSTNSRAYKLLCHQYGLLLRKMRLADFLRRCGRSFARACETAKSSVHILESLEPRVFLDGVPVAPSNLAAAVISTRDVHFSWNDNSDNETSFVVQKSRFSNFMIVDHSYSALPSGSITLDVDDLLANRKAYYRVVAVNESGNSSPSNVVAVLPADFSGNGTLNAADIDAMTAHIGTSDTKYDLDGDGNVTQADKDLLIRNVFFTEYGDVNLDGIVEVVDGGADGAVISANIDPNVTGRGWADGDMNGDGKVTQDDLTLASGYDGLGGDSSLMYSFHFPTTGLVGQPYVVTLSSTNPNPNVGVRFAVQWDGYGSGGPVDSRTVYPYAGHDVVLTYTFDHAITGMHPFYELYDTRSDIAAVDSGETIAAIQIKIDDNAVSDIAKSVDENSSLSFSTADFTGSFSDADDGNPLQKVKITALPSAGTLALNGTAVTANQEIAGTDLASLTYTPGAHYVGSDGFTWNGSDSVGYTPQDAEVTIAVNAVNDNAVANLSKTLDENAATTFATDDFAQAFSDPDDGRALQTIEVSSLPQHGALELAGTAVVEGQEIAVADLGGLVYRPDADYIGSDSFSWSGSDGRFYAAASASVSLTVARVNDGCVTDVNLEYGSGVLAFSQAQFAAAFSDPDEGLALQTVKITSLPQHGVLTFQGQPVTVGQEIAVAAASDLSYTADSGYAGQDSFSWNGKDQHWYAPADASVLLSRRIDTSVSSFDKSLDQDSSLLFTQTDFTAAYQDPDDGNPLVNVRIEWLPTCGALTLDGSAVSAGQEIPAAQLSLLQYTPDSHYVGDDNFGWNATDAYGYSAAPAQVNLGVNWVNDNEVEDVSGWLVKDASLSFQGTQFVNAFSDADEANPLVRIKITSLPSSGTLTLASVAVTVDQEIEVGALSQLVYSPSADYVGTDSFGWNGADGHGYAAAAATVQLTVDRYAISDLIQTAEEDSPLTMDGDSFRQAFRAPDGGDALDTVQVTSLPLHGLLALDGVPVVADQEISADDLDDLTYSPASGYVGPDSFLWTGAGQDGYAIREAAARLNVQAVQDETVTSVSKSLNENTSTAFSAQEFIDAFEDGRGRDLMTLAFTSLPEHGRLKLSGVDVAAGQEIPIGQAAALSYTPDAGYVGDDSFAWTGSDGYTFADPAAINITVDSVNDNVVLDVSRPVAKGGSVSFSPEDFQSGFDDPDDGNALVTVKIVSLPASGTLSLGGVTVTDGQAIALSEVGGLTYTPSDQYVGIDSFQWTGSDQYAFAVSPASTSMKVTDTAVSDFGKSVNENTSLIFGASDFAAAFSDPDDGNPLLTVQIMSLPQHGTLALDSVAVTVGEEIPVAQLATLTYAPEAHYVGSDSFGWAASDSFSRTPGSASVAITVAAVNDNSAADVAIEVYYNGPTFFSPDAFREAFSDPDDGHALQSIKIVSLPLATWGVLTLVDPETQTESPVEAGQVIPADQISSLKYTPAQGRGLNSTASFTWSGSDGQFDTAAAAANLSLSLPHPLGPVTLGNAAADDAVRNALGFAHDATIVASDLSLLCSSLILPGDQPLNLWALQFANHLKSLTVQSSAGPSTGAITSLTGLSGLTNLESLTLDGVLASGCDLTSLAGLTSLKTLSLQRDSISSCGVLSGLTGLTSLDLRYNSVTSLSWLTGQLPSLQTLRLYGNTITDSDAYTALKGRLVWTDLPSAATDNLVAAGLAGSTPDAPPSPGNALPLVSGTLLQKEVHALAVALHGLPVRAYEWVLNNIRYEPYMGVKKGPLGVLETGAGNDVDTCSLLVALLNECGVTTAAGTPSSGLNVRYARGPVTANIDKLESYLGVKTPQSVGAVLAYVDPSAVSLDAQGQQLTGFTGATKAATFNYAWVEVTNAQGQTFRLAPAWKFQDFQPGMGDMLDDVSFDPDPTHATGYFASDNQELPSEWYSQNVQDYLTQNDLGDTVADVAYDGPILAQRVDALSLSLPSDLNNTTESTFTTVPANLKYHMTVTINAQTAIDRDVADVCRSRIVIVCDASTNWHPKVLVDGSTYATLTGTVASGGALSIHVTITAPTGITPSEESQSFSQTSGHRIALCLNASQASSQSIKIAQDQANALAEQQRTLVHTAGSNSHANQAAITDCMLVLAGSKYGYTLSKNTATLAGMTGAVANAGNVTCGVMFADEMMLANYQFEGNLVDGILNQAGVLVHDPQYGSAPVVTYDGTGTCVGGEGKAAKIVAGANPVALWNATPHYVGTNYTVSYFFCPQTFSQPNMVFGGTVYSDGSTSSGCFIGTETTGELSCGLGPNLRADTGITLSVGHWYHVAFSCATDSSGSTGHLYVTELANASGSPVAAPMLATITNMPTPNASWNSLLIEQTNAYYDSLQVYPWALDGQEVASLYGGGSDTSVFPYLPLTIAADMPDDGAARAIDVSNPSSAVSQTREALLGWEKSALEGEVLQEVTGRPAMSTARAMQIANQSPTTQVVRVDASSLSSQPAVVQAEISQVFTHDSSAVVYIPKASLSLSTKAEDGTASGTWSGFGYYLISGSGARSYVIDGGVAGLSELTRGGATTAVPQPVSLPDRDAQHLGSPGAIDLSNGDVSLQAQDLSLGGAGMPLAFTRYYHSATGGLDWGLGAGWSYSYHDTLMKDTSTGDMIWSTSDGRTVRFKKSGTNVWTTPDGMHGSLTLASNVYTWKDSGQGDVYTFSVLSAVPNTWTLTTMKDCHGSSVTITWTTCTNIVGQLIAVPQKVTSSRSGSESLTFAWATGGHRCTLTDNYGRVWTWDESTTNGSQTWSVTAPDSSKTGYSYYADGFSTGLLKTMQDAKGGVTTYSYYSNGMGYGVTDPTGRTQYAQYDLYRKHATWVDASGNSTVCVFDDEGNIKELVHPDGTMQKQTVVNGEVTDAVDVFGVEDTWGYDTVGRVTQHVKCKDLADQLTTTYAYDQTGTQSAPTYNQPIAVTVAPTTGSPRVTSYAYKNFSTDLAEVCSVTDALGNVTNYTFAGGQLATMVVGPAATSTTTTYAYQAGYGRLTSVTTHATDGTLASDVVKVYTYDAHGYLATSKDPLLNVTTYVNDVLGRMTSSAASLGITQSSTYDQNGNLKTQTDALGYVTSDYYDGCNRLTRATYADGTWTQTAYGANGKAASTYDQAGNRTDYGYDGNGNLIEAIAADGSVTRSLYSGGRLIRSVDGNDNATSYEYDGAGRTISTTDALGHATSQSYDAYGDVVSVTDALGRATTYGYDALGHQVSTTDAMDHTSTTTYDSRGNVTYVTDVLGHTTAYGYDALNRKIWTTDALGVPGGLLADYKMDEGSGGAATDYSGNGNNATITSGGWTTSGKINGGLKSGTLTRSVLPVATGDYSISFWFKPNASGTITVNWGGTSGLNLKVDSTGKLSAALGSTTKIQVSSAVWDRDWQFVTFVYDGGLGQFYIGTKAVGNAVSMGAPSGTSGLKVSSLAGVLDDLRVYSRALTTEELGDLCLAQDHTSHTSYDANGNVTETVDTLGHKTDYTFDQVNRQVAVRNALGNTTTTTYDANGNVVTTSDALGNTTVYEYDRLNRKISVTDATDEPNGLTSRLRLDGDQTDSARTGSATVTGGTSWATGEIKRSLTLASGSTLTNSALPASTSGDYTVSFWINPSSVPTGDILTWNGLTITVASGTVKAKSSGSYWAAGPSGTTVAANSWQLVTFAYDHTTGKGTMYLNGNAGTAVSTGGLPQQTVALIIQNILGSVDDVRVYNRALLAGEVAGLAQGNHAAYIQYDSVGNVAASTDQLGRRTTYVYDALGRAVSTSDPMGNVTTTRYDRSGNVVATTDALGNTTSYGYDALNRKVSVTDPLKHTTTTTYDAAGNVIATTDALGDSTVYQYDALNRNISVTDATDEPNGLTCRLQLDGDLKDSAGNADATLAGNTTWTAAGEIKGALTLGSGSTLTTSPLSASSDYSISFWINPSSVPTEDILTWNGLAITVASGTVKAKSSGSYWAADPSGTTVTPNSWQLVTFVYDHTTAKGTMYLNGNAGTAVSTGGLPQQTVALIIQNIVGSVDDVRVYNRALSAGEVAGLAQGNHTSYTTYDWVGNVTVSTDQFGRTTNYAYDAIGQQLTVTSPHASGDTKNYTSTTTYDACGNVTSSSNALGETTTYEYDALNRQISTTDPTDVPLGLVLHLAMDGSSSTATDPNYVGKDSSGFGRDTAALPSDAVYVSDGVVGGRLSWPSGTGTISVPGLAPLTGDYTISLWLKKSNVTTNCSLIQWGDFTLKISAGQLQAGIGTTMISSAAISANTWYLVTFVRDHAGQQSRLYVHSQTASLDPVLPSTEVTMADGSGSLTSFSMYHIGGIDDVRVYNRALDGPEVRALATAQANATSTTVYDHAGNVGSMADESGNATHYAYDAKNQQIKEGTSASFDPSETMTYGYDAAGQLVSLTDKNGRQTAYVYDQAGRQVDEKWLDSDGVTVVRDIHSVYDADGNLLEVSDPDSVYRYAYDAAGRLKTQEMEIPPQTGSTNLINNVLYHNGTLDGTDLVDSSGHHYDVYPVFLQANTASSFMARLPWAPSNITPLMYPLGSNQQLLQEMSNDPTGSQSLLMSMGAQDPYGYQPNQSLATGWYDVVVRRTDTNTAPVGYNLQMYGFPGIVYYYEYDAVGNQTALIDSQQSETTFRSYDACSRPTDEMDDVVQTDIHAAFRYFADGSLQSITRYNSSTGSNLVTKSTYSYDPAGNLQELKYSGAGMPDYQYTWDTAGRMLSMSDGTTTKNYSYDLNGQVVENGSTGNWIDYDASGNKVGAGISTGDDNKLLTEGGYTYTYDNEGNVQTETDGTTTETFNWDHRNRLASVVTTNNQSHAVAKAIGYKYDAFNNRIEESVDLIQGGSIALWTSGPQNGQPKTTCDWVFYYQGDNLRIRFLDSDGDSSSAGSMQENQRYFFGPNTDQVLATWQPDGSGISGDPTERDWYVTDLLGSVRKVVSASPNYDGTLVTRKTQDYDAFGENTDTSSTGGDLTSEFPFGYTGREYDAQTGLYNYRARWYDPKSGRFLSQDPSGFGAGDMNLYRYCGNNPLSNADPSGLDFMDYSSSSWGSSWDSGWSGSSWGSSWDSGWGGSSWGGYSGYSSYGGSSWGSSLSSSLYGGSSYSYGGYSGISDWGNLSLTSNYNWALPSSSYSSSYGSDYNWGSSLFSSSNNWGNSFNTNYSNIDLGWMSNSIYDSSSYSSSYLYGGGFGSSPSSSYNWGSSIYSSNSSSVPGYTAANGFCGPFLQTTSSSNTTNYDWCKSVQHDSYGDVVYAKAGYTSSSAYAGAGITDIHAEGNGQYGKGQARVQMLNAQANASYTGVSASAHALATEAGGETGWRSKDKSTTYLGVAGQVTANVATAQAHANVWSNGQLLDLGADAAAADASASAGFVVCGYKFGASVRGRAGVAVGVGVGRKTSVDIGPIGATVTLFGRD